MADKVLAIGDEVKVVAPDPKHPTHTGYIGLTGKIVENSHATFGRSPYCVEIDNHEERGCSKYLCFCAEELGPNVG